MATSMEQRKHSLFDTDANRSLLDPSYDEEEDHKCGAWSFKSTIAFACSVLFMNGSILFMVGAAMSLKGVLPAGDEFPVRAMIDYPYFIGAVNFLIANYLVYFQVINKLGSHGSSNKDLAPQPLYFFVRPQRNLGHLACLSNLFGAVLYGVSTANMFFDGDYTLVTDIPAITGSVCFILGAVLEGEYNTWRACSNTSIYEKLPVIQAYCYTGGATLFLLGYCAMWHHWSAASAERADHWVNMPFLLGSFFFLVGSMCDMIMWKKKIYGLGFAKALSPSKKSVSLKTQVDWRQLAMLWVYCILMCLAQVNIGLFISIPKLQATRAHHALPHFLREILTYTGIMLLASVIHTTPDQYPYNLLLWFMRIIALLDLFAQTSDFVFCFESLGYWDHDPGYSKNTTSLNMTFT